jgi:hypothetical protein
MFMDIQVKLLSLFQIVLAFKLNLHKRKINKINKLNHIKYLDFLIKIHHYCIMKLKY